MREVNERCKMLEEHKYWNEFEPNNHQFFKILICDFEQRLRVPKKFVRNFRGSLLSPIRLKGPSGDTWTVEAVRTSDQVVFQNGWGKFVQDHGLKESDFLVFHYAGDSCFNVLIFDNSGCEREASYFVNKHGISCSDTRCVMERNKEEVPTRNAKKAHHEIIDLDEEEEEDTKQEVKAKCPEAAPIMSKQKQPMGVNYTVGSMKRVHHGLVDWDEEEEDTKQEVKAKCPEAAPVMSKQKQSMGVNNTMGRSMKKVRHGLVDWDDDEEEDTMHEGNATSSFRHRKPENNGVQGMKPIGSREDAMQKQTQGMKLAATHSMQDGKLKLGREGRCSEAAPIKPEHKEWVEVKGNGSKRKIQDADGVDAVKKQSTTAKKASGSKSAVKLEHKPKMFYSYVPKYKP